MKRERVPFLLFAVFLIAAMPVAWGAVGAANSNLVKETELTGEVSNDVSTKVTLCHVPPGNPAIARTIVVDQTAVAAHLAHGDYLGECHSACAGVPAPLPKTGQTGCWDQEGQPIACAGSGQDGDYQKGVAVDPRFTDNGDFTVTDNLTGLIWLKLPTCLGSYAWSDAITQASALASGDCGLTDGSVAGDWRLPNRKELESLIDLGQTYPALPAGHPFLGLELGWYWSSTAYAYDPFYAWYADLFYGYVSTYYKSNQSFVWPVRGGQ